MITTQDLTSIYSLMGEGIIIGGLIAVLSYFIGYWIGFVIGLVRRA